MQVSKEETEYKFTTLERFSVGCFLQTSTNQLAIIQTGVSGLESALRPTKPRNIYYGSTNNCETGHLTEKPYVLLEYFAINKIRYFTESVLETLWKELVKEGTTDSIKHALLLEHTCRYKNMELFELSKKYSKKVDDTENQTKQLLMKSTEQINNKEIQLAVLQDELLDLQYHKEVSLSFTKQRIGCKLSQVSLWLHERQCFLTQTTDINVLACELQDRVHVEILNYLDSDIENLKELLDYWRERNKTEMTQMNSKLERLQQDRKEQSTQLQALKFLFQKHNEEIRLYIEERTAREQKAEMQQHVNEMATRIQAWWRGTMVRRHLGPYKADKRKKPKDKAKKKK